MLLLTLAMLFAINEISTGAESNEVSVFPANHQRRPITTRLESGEEVPVFPAQQRSLQGAIATRPDFGKEAPVFPAQQRSLQGAIATRPDFGKEAPVFPATHQRSLQLEAIPDRSRCPTKVPSNRIMFGSHTGPYHDATYFVHLSIKERSRINTCSGVLFNPSLILTCAHCWQLGQINGSTAYAGVADNQQVESGVSRRVKDVVLHHKYYMKNDRSFDLAIVEVEPPFDLVEGKLTTIGFASSEPAVFTSDKWIECQIAGSGQSFTQEGDKCTDKMKRLYMSGILISLKCCNDAVSRLGKPLGHKFPVGTICLRNNSDAGCAGDSGSGVVCKYKPTGKKMLVGVLRAGPQCCDLNDNKLNDPIERNIVTLDIARRIWISKIANTHFLFGSLTRPPP